VFVHGLLVNGTLWRKVVPRLEASAKLDRFEGRAVIVWAPEDRFFPLEHARRLAGALRDARIEQIHDSYTFVSEDQPAPLAELIENWSS
jgi:pimeloyl-ACP methyl ester carboxylesterase